MFLGLTMVNVRRAGQVSYCFDDKNRIILRGMNGSGKTTVCEALTFALTGRDASGGLCPTHLIARAENGLKTIVAVGKWELVRTLTRKKNTTLTARHGNDPEFKVTNSQLFDILGFENMSPDVYTAATVPGFFMQQPSTKRFSILSMILPRFDRTKFVAEFSGFSEEIVDRMCGKFERGIPNWHNFSHYRVDIQKKKAKIEGRIEEISANRVSDMTCPVEPASVRLLPIASKYLQDTNTYTSEFQQFVTAKNHRDYVILESERRGRIKEDIERRISELVLFEPLKEIDTTLLKELQGQLKKRPEKPSVMSLPSSDCCSSCGQVVGSLLRERVEAENAKKIEEYNTTLFVLEMFNEDICRKIVEEEKRIEEILKHNEQVRSRSRSNQELDASLRKQLLTVEPMHAPEIMPMPTRPEMPEELVKYGIGPYRKDIFKLQTDSDNYLKKLGAYEKFMQDKQEGEDTIKALSVELATLERDLVGFEKLEHALRILPQEEVSAQKGRLKLKNYVMDFSDGFDIRHESGTPYECLSAGEQATLNIALCVKFQDFMEVKPGWCFVDDADLLHDIYALDIPSYIQTFFAQVTLSETSQDVDVIFKGENLWTMKRELSPSQ